MIELTIVAVKFLLNFGSLLSCLEINSNASIYIYKFSAMCYSVRALTQIVDMQPLFEIM